MSYLTDVYGPRLTGSPITRRAADYTIAQLKSWGMTNPRLETWGPFGRGWTNDKFCAQITGPVAFPVIGYPQAWTPGTNGLVTSEVVYVKIDSETDYATYRGKLGGKIVMLAAGSARDGRGTNHRAGQRTPSSARSHATCTGHGRATPSVHRR